MKLNEYQKLAMRTKNKKLSKTENLLYGAMGLCGEAGEVSEPIKKCIYHGHSLVVSKNDIIEEIGDCMWNIALLCDTLGVTMEEMAMKNIDKLKERYPNGFSDEKSVNRKEYK